MTKLHTLVLDSAPLLTGTTHALIPLAERFATTSDVLSEIRDAKSRELLEQSQLDLKVQSPSAEAMVHVTNFARQTGDLAVLSHTDLRICALALTLEMQLNGLDRVRPSLGKPSPAEARQKARAEQRRARRHAKKQQKPVQEATSTAEPPKPAATEIEEDEGWQQVGSSRKKQEQSDDDSDGGEWITPDNVKEHRAKALGLNPAQVSTESSEAAAKENDQASDDCACLTGDFAMQNVLLQMGLPALGPDGMRVKQVRTWVLRCHACFKLCKNPTEKFCPSCGNATLMRTSITYLDAPTPEHPQGYVLHLKKNFQYHNKGSIYSLPTPQSIGGSAKGPKSQVIILRPDQKEYIRGKKTYDIKQRKEERQAQRELAEAQEGGRPQEWVPTLDMSETARNRATGGHQTNSIRTDKAGMPLIGIRGNPNRVGKKRA